MARISLIIPVWNKGSLLYNPLESVSVQGHEGEFECILVDDGSTDGSGALCDEYAAKYPGIFKVIHQSNQGRSAARDTGIETATGEWIGFMDCDDEIMPDFMERMLACAARYSSDAEVNIIQYASKRYNLGGKLRSLVEIPAQEYIPYDRRFPGREYCWDKLYRKSFLDKYGIRFLPGYDLCEDVMFNIQALARAGGLLRVPYHGYKKYDYPTNGYSSRTAAQMRKAVEGYDLLEKKMKDEGVDCPYAFREIAASRKEAQADVRHVGSPGRKVKYFFIHLFRPDETKTKAR